MTSGSGSCKEKPENKENNKCDPECIEDSCCLSIVENILESVSGFFTDSGCNVVSVSVIIYDVSNTTCDEHGSQCCDEWWKFKFTNQITVYNTYNQCKNNCYNNCYDRVHSLCHHGC